MEPIAIYGEAVAGRSAQLRKHIRALAQDLSKNTFDIAEAFLEAQESHCYAEWGFDSLGAYASLELGIKHRRAQYLARIVRVCRAAGVARVVYEPVGVTKLREITTLNPESLFWNPEEKRHEPMVEHIVRLIAEAPENSTNEVDEEVARLKGQTGDNAMVTKSYRVTKSAYENTIKIALEAMRKILGSKGRDGTGAAIEYPDGTCFEYILREWLNDPHNFMEESDESHEQIEVSEENNVRTAGAPISMDSTEAAQDTLPSPRHIIPSEQ